MIKNLASNWEQTFAQKLPNVLQNLLKKLSTKLKIFHNEVETRCMQQGVGIAGMAMLRQQ